MDKIVRHFPVIQRIGGVICLLALTGCTAAGVAATFAAATGASLMHTDRTLTDHAVSRYTEKDCALLHLGAGQNYCLETEEAAETAIDPQTHCYRSIAEISCYTVANPNETASRRMPAVR